MTQILFPISVLLGIAIVTLIWLRSRNNRTARELWRLLETPPATETFTPAAIADLPEPVQRYFLHAIQPGTPLASSVQVKMNGAFKIKANMDADAGEGDYYDFRLPMAGKNRDRT